MCPNRTDYNFANEMRIRSIGGSIECAIDRIKGTWNKSSHRHSLIITLAMSALMPMPCVIDSATFDRCRLIMNARMNTHILQYLNCASWRSKIVKTYRKLSDWHDILLYLKSLCIRMNMTSNSTWTQVSYLFWLTLASANAKLKLDIGDIFLCCWE